MITKSSQVINAKIEEVLKKEAGRGNIVKSVVDFIKNNPGSTAAGFGLGAGMLGEAILDDVGDVIKQKYISENKPAWEEAGMAPMKEQAAQEAAAGTQEAFGQLAGSNVVQHLGEEKARAIFDQVSQIAPTVISRAPGVALSALESAVASGTTSLRPEIIKSLADAERSLKA